MRAAYYEQKGPPSVLRLGEVPTPDPGPGEVRVRVAASGINPSDTKGRQGWSGDAGMPFPRIVPHNDGAGTIDAVGENVSPARLGERVWVYEAQRDGRAFGTAAEFVVVPAENAVRLPEGIGFEIGASLGVPAMTAHRCLLQDGPVAGQTILVAGGAGSVGLCAVQLAKWAGAGTVIATVGSAEQAEVARRAGADHVIDYRREDVKARVGETARAPDGRGVDRVVEVAFGANVALDAAVLKPNGAIATYATSDDPNDAPKVPFYQLLASGITVHFNLVYIMPEKAHEHAIRDITAALEAGALDPPIARRFALDQIVEAHEAVGTGGLGGKAVVVLG